MKTIAVLSFVLLMLTEIMISALRKNKRYNLRDTLENIGTGIVSLLFDHFFSIISLPLLIWIYDEYRMVEWKNECCYYLFLFMQLDLTEYWFHRLSHQVPLMWAAHKVHHQSHRFNLSVGLRTSFVIPFFNLAFYCLLPLSGFHPYHVLSFIFIQGTFQLLVHTESVKKLGILDRIFVTPSVHRVHHGKNEEYLDRNFGKMLLIWDHLFRTYKCEDVPVIYGATDDENESGILKCQWMPLKKWWRKKFVRD